MYDGSRGFQLKLLQLKESKQYSRLDMIYL